MLSWVTDDFDGNPRGSTNDVGPYQYQNVPDAGGPALDAGLVTDSGVGDSGIGTTAGCYAIGNAWTDGVFALQSSRFTFAYLITPSKANLNTLIGLSDHPVADYSDTGPAVSFSAKGSVVALNGGTYTSDAVVTYQGGTTYSVHLRSIP
jgi:hypothetical protein